jgi:CRISPR-associated protein Cas1
MTITSTEALVESQETIRVNALHALNYCPRLYYLEEVEQLYTQDASVFAGRRLHVEIEKDEDAAPSGHQRASVCSIFSLPSLST